MKQLMLVAAMVCLSSAFADAVIKKSAQTWNATSTNVWQGAIPEFGPGVKVKFGLNGGGSVYLATNVTVGAFVVDDDVTPASKSLYSIYRPTTRTSTSVDPVTDNYKWGLMDKVLTMDSGSDAEPAVIGGLRAPTHANSNSIYRVDVDVPVRMASDLVLRHYGRRGAPGGSSGDGENVSLWMVGDISDDGEKHLLVTDAPYWTIGTSYFYPSIALAGNNTFTGDVDIRGWTRCLSRTGFDGRGTQLGVNNNVFVTNACAILDLGGHTFGPDHHLYLGGATVYPSDVANSQTLVGKLTSLNLNPNVTANWQGPVTLTDDAAIGGGFYSTYPISSMSGAIRIDGDIGDDGGNRSLTVATAPGLTLGGRNTFGGDIRINKGSLTVERPDGLSATTRYAFNGGRLRMTAADQPDFSTRSITPDHDMTIRLDLDGDFTFEPQAGFTNMYYCYKTGRGTLVLSKPGKSSPYGSGNHNMDFYCMEGETIFDYSVSDTHRLSAHSYFATLGVGNGAKITMKTKSNQKTLCDCEATDYSTGDIVKEGGATVYVMSPKKNGTGLLNLTVEKGKFITVNTTTAYTDADPLPGTIGESLIWSNRTWISLSGVNYVPFTNYTNDWTTPKGFIDVTPELLAKPIPSGFSVAAIRFDTPFDGDTVTLNMDGVNELTGGTILVTPNFGSDKTIRLVGGTLKRPTAGSIRFVSYATNTTFLVESDLAQNAGANVNFVVYNSKVQFKGDSSLLGAVGVVGGVLEVWDEKFLGGVNGANRNVGIHLNQGGVIRTHGDMTLSRTVGSYVTCPYFRIYEKGGGLDVADGTLSVGTAGEMAFYDRGEFVKCGAGHFNWNKDLKRGDVATKWTGTDGIARYRFIGGRVTMGGNGASNFGEKQCLFTASNNVAIAGANAFNVNLGGANGGGNVVDSGCKCAWKIGDGGATFDNNGANTAIGSGGGDGDGYRKSASGDFFVGTGDLVFTNSSATAAYLTFKGLNMSHYTGTIVNYTPQTGVQGDGGGFFLPGGEYRVPEGVSAYFYQIPDELQPFRIGRLTGAGTFQVAARNNYFDPIAYVGRDADETFQYDGRLEGLSLAYNYHASARFVKVGTNRWRLTNPSGNFQGATSVANGDLLVATDAAATSSSVFGKYTLYVGDEHTPADGVPRLLTDGPYVIANEVKILSASPATARPSIGGASATAASTFAGKVTYYRSFDLYSAGGKVTFTGKFVNAAVEDVSVGKTGPGEIVVENAESVLPLAGGYDWTGGTLTVAGVVTIPDGAVLTVDASLCTKENEDTVFVLLQAGAIAGRFTLATTLPDGWGIKYTNGKVVLRHSKGMLLLVR